MADVDVDVEDMDVDTDMDVVDKELDVDMAELVEEVIVSCTLAASLTEITHGQPRGIYQSHPDDTSGHSY